MPGASKETASRSMEMDGYEGHVEDLGDGWTVAFERYTMDADAAPFFRGLPDDRCQCPHFGYVLSGKVTFRFADREESFEAGDAYHAPPGHTPVMTAGTEVVEFSDTAELARTMEVISANLQAQG